MKRILIGLCILFTITSSVFGQIDYNSQVQPIFNNKCIACHGGTSGVTVTDYVSTMGSIGVQYGTLIVMPTDTASSPLWDKINPNPLHGNRMPISGTMSAADINTIGQWIIEGALPVPITGVQTNTKSPTGFRLISCYPNPFNPSTTVQVVNQIAAQIKINVFNTQGQIVHTIADHYEAGHHDIPIDLTNQPSGMYVVQMQMISMDQLMISENLKTTLMK